MKGKPSNQTGQIPPALHYVAAAGVVGLIYIAGRQDFAALDLGDTSVAMLGQLLASFLFLALLIERATELILSARFGGTEIAITAPFKQAADRNAAEMTMLARDMDLLVSPQDRMTMVDDGLMHGVTRARQTLPTQAGETRRKLEDLSLRKKLWATWTSLILAVALSLSGFQLLHDAFGTQIGLSGLPAIQMSVFSFVDICLTAIVLAGGSNGIHHLIRRLIDFGRQSKTSILQD